MSIQTIVGNLAGLMRVGVAAKYIGVSSGTLRNWHKTGRLVPTAHPVTGYRYYRREDLEAFLVPAILERESE